MHATQQQPSTSRRCECGAKMRRLTSLMTCRSLMRARFDARQGNKLLLRFDDITARAFCFIFYFRFALRKSIEISVNASSNCCGNCCTTASSNISQLQHGQVQIGPPQAGKILASSRCIEQCASCFPIHFRWDLIG